jgi:hypothetical protein
MAKTTISPIESMIRRLAGDHHTKTLSDRELLGRFCAGKDQAAFGSLVRRHGPMVLNVCRNVANTEQDAEDAFQATFIVLARVCSFLVASEHRTQRSGVRCFAERNGGDGSSVHPDYESRSHLARTTWEGASPDDELPSLCRLSRPPLAIGYNGMRNGPAGGFALS